ncbi:peptide ABC transporter substrate-binding protein [Candidatus Parcubacteria bacterium]|nr:peptide ABC transporter substrate-binding protein [Candidatus Parcubacteria bacterium]
MPQKIYQFLLNIYKEVKNHLAYIRNVKKRIKMVNVEKKAILDLFKKKRFPRPSQFRYLPRFLNKKEKTFLVIFSILTLSGIVGFVSLLYFNNTVEVAGKGGEYTEGIVGYTRFINPLYSQNNEVDKDLTALVYSGLTKRNERLNVVMDLAESYEVNEDETIYTFKLKENVLWHDGQHFTADDVVFTINAIKNPNYNSPIRTSWADVEATKINDLSVQFKLKKSFGNFLSLTTIGILPKHIWEKVPVANINLAEANNKPVGTGPYKFKSFTKDKVGAIKAYEFVVNDKYYTEDPNLNKIILKFYPEYISAINALDNRQIDGLSFVSTEAMNDLKLRGRLNSYNIQLPQYTALFFNESNNAILKDTNIRQALALAIDRKRIIKEALLEDGTLIESPILPGFFGPEEDASHLVSNKEDAQKILVDNDWVLKDGNKYRAKGSTPLKIALSTIEKGQNVKAAGIIKENWEAIGIEVELKIISTSNLNVLLTNRNYGVFLFGQMYGTDLDPYAYWHSSAIKYPGLNLAGYSDRKADALLEQARTTSDKVVKQQKYQEFEALLTENFPAIFLWEPKYNYLIDKKIKGFKISNLLTPSDRFTNLFSAYIKTKRVFR